MIRQQLLRGMMVLLLGTLGAMAEEPVEVESPRWGAVLGVGRGNEGMGAYRIGLQREFKSRWFESGIGYLTGFHEAGVGAWNDDDTIYVVSYSPVFTYRFNMELFEPYIELGIGASAISETRIVGREMSSTFQFEDRLGFGARFGKGRRHDLNFRFLHYSNADLWLPNQGVDIFMGSYAYRF